MKLFFDTETTGLAKFNLPASSSEQPRLVQLGMILLDDENNVVHEVGLVVRPDGFEIPPMVAAIHGISQDRAMKYGVPISVALGLFVSFQMNAKVIIGHNLKFDKLVVEGELYRFFEKNGVSAPDISASQEYCTMLSTTDICRIPNKNRGGYKWPKLSECYKHFFNEELVDAHDALTDVRATARIYNHLHAPAKSANSTIKTNSSISANITNGVPWYDNVPKSGVA